MSWSIPVKTEWMKSQTEHKPSMEYAKDIYKVASQMDDFLALEIGAAWGISALALLEAGAKHLTSVDPNVKAEAENEAKANGYTNHVWTCVRSDKFWQENTTTYDLIYVDGSHDYEDVKNDLNEAWKVLNPGGMMLVDDYTHRFNLTDYGVSLACWEFFRDNPCELGTERTVLWFRKAEDAA